VSQQDGAAYGSFYTLVKSRIKTITVDVKWLVLLDFTLLWWQTTLNCVPLTMAYHCGI
jgi:hypothetical protein